MSIKDYVECEHCQMLVSPGELEFLSAPLCTILKENETYMVCEYCTGYHNETWYWNDWVSRKRRGENVVGRPG